MKKILYLAFSLLLCSSCDDFLDFESRTTKNDGNFPVNETDISQMLSSVYSQLSGGGVIGSYFFTAQLASDDCFGGGGVGDKVPQATDHLLVNGETTFDSFWSTRYKGINRANSVLAVVDNIKDENLRNQKKGEALFLRSFYYFELTQLFEKVPLIDKSPSDVSQAQTAPAQASADDVYKRIATDLKEACEIMPSKKWNEYQFGTATKWAAEALLARVYLFYTGFYEKSSLPTEDGEIDKEYVIDKLQDCIDNSGHSLVPDYRSLWTYTNSATKKDYPYDADAKEWIRDGFNPEQVFAINFAYLSSWDNNRLGFANFFALYFGLRDSGSSDRYDKTFPFGKGWGMGPVSPSIYNEWKEDEPDDMRRDASVYQVYDGYVYGGDNQMEETGLWQKKIIPISCYENGTRLASFCSSKEYWGDGITSNFQTSHCQALTLIRYSDILLMQAELKEDVSYINLVRARVNLEPLASYSLEALQKERRYELAFEGLRWGDMRRWHIAENSLADQLNQKIYNQGTSDNMRDQGIGYVQRYKETRGFFPIPKTEIDLSNGALIQNPGWGDVSSMFSNWK